MNRTIAQLASTLTGLALLLLLAATVALAIRERSLATAPQAARAPSCKIGSATFIAAGRVLPSTKNG